MYAKRTVIINKSGLHARPGTLFVREAKRFQSNLTVVKLDAEGSPVKEANAKSIALVMALQLSKGTRIEIRADGEDEGPAVDALIALVDAGLGDL